MASRRGRVSDTGRFPCYNAPAMMLLALSLPLGFLSLYLGCLGWRKNRTAGTGLLLFGVLNLGFSLAVAVLVFFFSQHIAC